MHDHHESRLSAWVISLLQFFCSRDPESQNGSGWRDPQSGVIWSNLSACQGPPGARGRGLHPGISWIWPIRETLQPLWTTCSSVWWPVQSRSSSSCSTGTCCALLPAASCPIAWHLREEPGSFLWHSPFSTYGQWWSPLSIISSGGWTGPVPSAFPWEMVQSPHHLWSP